MRLRPLVRGIAESVCDLLFPSVCLACGRGLTIRRELLCEECRSSLRPLYRDDALYIETSRRLMEDVMIAGLVSRYVFEKGGPLQALLHELKYRGMTRVGLDLGREVGSTIATWIEEIHPTAIVPVPLHPMRKRERGYNQTEYLARGIREVTGIPLLSSALIRRRDTRSQTTLDRYERADNVRGAFQVSASESRHLRGRTVLLVDDVITTGSTLRECAQALGVAGTHSVVACSVALAALDI